MPSIGKYSGLVGCEAVPLVQRFSEFRKAIMSSYSGSSSPRTDSLTRYMKVLLRFERQYMFTCRHDVKIQGH